MKYVLGRVCARPGCGAVISLERITCEACWYSHVPEFIRNQWRDGAPMAALNVLRRQIFAWFKAPESARRGCSMCDCRFFHPATRGRRANACHCGHYKGNHDRVD